MNQMPLDQLTKVIKDAFNGAAKITKSFQTFFIETMILVYFPHFTAKTVAIATKVAVRFGDSNINVYLCTAKTVATATKVAVRIV